jgi:DNA (cytosine-5)-methyltransferase 1
MFRFIDLFAGIGGFRLALSEKGGKCVFSSEWDHFAQKTYFENFKEIPQGDITQIHEKNIPDFDCLTAGFPCQPFSSIGKREGFLHPTQGTLFYEIIRIIKYKRPKFFILENVEGLLNHDHGKTFKTIISSLAISENGVDLLLPEPNHLGYHVYWKVLNAKDYDVPQMRKRIYIIGFDSKIYPHIKFNFPQKSNQESIIGPFVQKNITGYSISKHLQEKYLFKLNDGLPQIVDQNSKIAVKTLVSSYHKIQRLTGTFVSDHGSETGIRLLNEMECKAIMSFPNDFKIPVSRTQMYRQMGNSVAVSVIKNLISQILNAVNTHS